jgi:spore germination cell wall hydrolase CwlJ-like protein
MVHLVVKLFLCISLLGAVLDTEAGDASHQLVAPPYTTHANFTPSRSPTDLECLTDAIYYEAGNQSLEGKEAVGIVVINRVVHPRYPNTICGVVTQSFIVNEKRVCQFSYYCEDPKGINKHAWAESRSVAKRLLTNSFDRAILSKLDEAIYFHAKYVHPQWSTKKELVAIIDQHLFYKEPSL